MDNNDRAYDALIPGIFGSLAEQVMAATIKNEKDLQSILRGVQISVNGSVVYGLPNHYLHICRLCFLEVH